ncbi:MAG TPA: hypothetical protein VMJ75_16170 [Candidatus Acidoferrales bacterium]|nr:hypothetical protein [Candidatus Acidoferrales bacterium]
MRNRWIPPLIGVSALALALIPFGSQAFQSTQQPTQPAAQPTPQQLAIQQGNKEDHRQMMDRLHIASLRPGVNARVPGSTNYDEAKANPYPDLPDPLTMKNGKKVTSARMWWDRRRPEIVEDFDREIYGRVPKSVPNVKWEVTKAVNESVGDVPIVTKTLVGHVDNSAYPEIAVDIQLSLSTPADAKAPVPVIMVFGGGFGAAQGGPPPAVAPELAGAGAGQRMGLRHVESGQHSGRQRRGPEKGNHRSGKQGRAAPTR